MITRNDKKYGRSHVSTVLVFGPESVSYERSRRAKHAKMQHFSARAFFDKIPKCQNSMICAIFRFFRIQVLKNVLVQICPGPAKTRAHVGPGPGPYMDLARPIHGPGSCRCGFEGPNMC